MGRPSTAQPLAKFIEDPEWLIPPYQDEPTFPEPYLGIYRRLVREAEEDTAFLPGAGTLTAMLIRKVARDYVAGLMADRKDSFEVSVQCPSCRTQVFRPWWPHKDARMMQGFRELLVQIRSADLGSALRTEFVLELASETLRVIDSTIDDSAERVLLKEAVRGGFSRVLEDFSAKRLKEKSGKSAL